MPRSTRINRSNRSQTRSLRLVLIQPLVVDKEGVIIVGHGRYFAALKLGISEVPCVEVDLDDERARAYRLADNKLNESAWDLDLAMAEVKLLTEEVLKLTGFTQLDIDRYEWEAPRKARPHGRLHHSSVLILGHPSRLLAKPQGSLDGVLRGQPRRPGRKLTRRRYAAVSKDSRQR